MTWLHYLNSSVTALLSLPGLGRGSIAGRTERQYSPGIPHFDCSIDVEETVISTLRDIPRTLLRRGRCAAVAGVDMLRSRCGRDPELHLPAGRWQILATAQIREGETCIGAKPDHVITLPPLLVDVVP
jgi:hypothetical protein